MTITTIVKPYADDQGNKIIGTAKEAVSTKIIFNGKNCTLEIGEGVKLRETIIRFDAHDATIHIGDNSQFRGTIRVGIGCAVHIGRSLTVTEKCYISAAERTNVIIGDDCMFASFNQIRTDDAHPIYDLNTRNRVNKSQSIKIGNHVWLGYNAVALSGSSIGSGSVVAFGSIVTSNIQENSICAGVPARVVRTDIAWERTHLNLTPPYEFDEPLWPLADFR